MPNWRSPLFDWDEGNTEHIIARHDVYPEETEQVFYSSPHVRRLGHFYEVLGRDDEGRYLFLVCVVRGDRLRVISARDMTATERRRYERHT